MSASVGELPGTKEILVFGEYEHLQVPVKKLVRMPQVRSAANPDLADIRESIKTHGLLNPIDIAVVTKEQLSEYIDFTNKLWGMGTDIADFLDAEVDGYFNLVIAGHTRTEAISQLQEEDPAREYRITSKIHNIADPSEIIALQLDENLHSKPAQERRAMAIVEAYMYGKVNGRWSNEQEFLAASKGKFSKGVLQEAIGFARLPAEIRDFVLGGYLSYNASVEIGRATAPLIDNIVANFGVEEDAVIPDEIKPDIADAMQKKMDVWIAHIQAKGLNSTAARTYIKGQVNQLIEQTQELRGTQKEEALFTMASEGQQRLEYLRALRREVWEAHHMLASVVDHSSASIMSLHTRLSRVENPEAQETLLRSLDRLRGELGQEALNWSVA